MSVDIPDEAIFTKLLTNSHQVTPQIVDKVKPYVLKLHSLAIQRSEDRLAFYDSLKLNGIDPAALTFPDQNKEKTESFNNQCILAGFELGNLSRLNQITAQLTIQNASDLAEVIIISLSRQNALASDVNFELLQSKIVQLIKTGLQIAGIEM